MAEQSLKEKTVKGVGWSAIDSIARYGITFFVSIVLARLLSPDEYGLIGIITVFITVFNGIVDGGFTNALIRKQDVADQDYNTAFITNLVVSVFLAILLFLLSPLIAAFFEREELTMLTRVMSVIVVVNGLAIVQKAKLTKKVDFKTQTKITLIASVASGAVGIVLALIGFGVWALVGQQITNQSLNTLLLWIFSRWRPTFVFSVASFRELWGFGWKLLVSGLIDSIWREIYQVIVGKFYSTETLGQYTRGQQFASLFSTNISAVVQRVSYPVLSSIQDDKTRLKDGYKRVIKTTMMVTFACMLGLAAISKSMVYVLIGEKWLPCVPMLQIICFQMMLYPLHAINLNMLQVQGRSDLFLKLEIIKKTIGVIPLCLGIFIDIYWMLWGSVIVGFISYYLNAYYSGPFLNYSVWQQIKDILPSFVISSIMALAVFAVGMLPITPYVLLFIQFIAGVLVLLLICETVKLPDYLELKSIVSSIINNKR